MDFLLAKMEFVLAVFKEYLLIFNICFSIFVIGTFLRFYFDSFLTFELVKKITYSEKCQHNTMIFLLCQHLQNANLS